MIRKKWIFVAAPLGMVIFIAIGGQVILSLWNWLLPELFGWKQITFWQALGLLALCRILFGGFSVRSNMRDRMHDRWRHMTPEEKEKVREKFQSRWGGDSPTPKPEA